PPPAGPRARRPLRRGPQPDGRPPRAAPRARRLVPLLPGRPEGRPALRAGPAQHDPLLRDVHLRRQPGARRHGRGPMSRACRVLIVDDEPNVRLVCRAALEADGYEVAEAGDGEEAVDRLRGAPVDLILLDLRMPLLDGLETLRHLREV